MVVIHPMLGSQPLVPASDQMKAEMVQACLP
jgi:hypothetical protein